MTTQEGPPALGAALQLLTLAGAVASVSFTLTTSRLFGAWREWLRAQRDRGRPGAAFLDNLFHCHYCLSHWVAAPLVVLLDPGLLPGAAGAAATLFCLVWLSALLILPVELAWRALGK